MPLPAQNYQKKGYLRIGEAAQYLGVSVKTLRRWEKKALLKAKRSRGGHRYYLQKDLDNYLKEKTKAQEKIVLNPHLGLLGHPLIAKTNLFVFAWAATFALSLSLFGLAAASFLPQDFQGKGSFFKKAVMVIFQSSQKTAGQNKLSLISSANPSLDPKVLGEETKDNNFSFSVRVPSLFIGTAEFQERTSFQDLVTFGSRTSFLGQATFEKDITAPNVIYSLTAGTGITIEGDQELTIKNADKGSDQLIWKTIAVSGQTSLTPSNNTDTLTFAGSGGVTITTDSTNKKVTISATSPDYTLSGWTDAGTDIYLTTSTDNVGIGTSSPSYKLHVAGTGYVSGAFTAAGNITLGDAATDTITFTGRLASGTSLLPINDLGADLGSSSLRFNNLYVANLNSNAGLSTSGQATFTYEPADTTYTESSVLINPTAPSANGFLLGLGVAGYQRAGIDVEGDLILGYNSAVSAPSTTDPLSIYGHSASKVASIDISGNLNIEGSLTDLSDTTLTINDNLSVAGGVLYLAGLSSSNSTTEGAIYFDTDNSQLMVYANGKWQADRTTATVIVATTNGSGASKNYEKADFVCGDSDCDTVIENAIAALPSGGGVVVLLEGTYVIDSDGIDITKSNVTLMGVGRATILQRGWSSSSYDGVISISSATGVTVTNLTIDGQKSTYTNIYQIGIYTYRANDLTINQTKIYNNDSDGIRIDPNWNSSARHFITNNYLTNNDNYGISILNASYIRENQFIVTNNHINGGVVGIYVEDQFYCSVGNNVITSTSTAAIYLNNAERCSVDGNTISEGGTYGIRLTASDKNIISNNNIYDLVGTSTYGIYISDSSSTENYLVGNIINGDFSSEISDAGTNTVVQHKNQFEVDANGNVALTVTQSGSADIVNVFDGSTEVFTILDGGNIGIGTTAPLSRLHVATNTSSLTGKSALIIDQLESEDIFTASASGTTVFKLENNGDLTLGSGQSGAAPVITLFGYNGGASRKAQVKFEDSGQIGIYDGTGNPVQLTLGQSPDWSNVGYINGANYLQIRGGANNKTSIGLATSTLPKNVLDVAGGMVIGSYAGANTAPTNGLLVSGNVGIGTTAPSATLTVIQSGETNLINLGAAIPSGSKGISIEYRSSDDAARIQAIHQGTAYKNLALNPSGGNVGIGTVNPKTKLQISDGYSLASALITTDSQTITSQTSDPSIGLIAANSSGYRAVFKGTRARGTLASPSVPASGDSVLSFLGSIYDGVDTEGTAMINFVVDGNVSSNVAPQRIGFYTSTTTGINRQERLTIKSDGNIGIGTTAPLSRLHVATNTSSLTGKSALIIDQLESEDIFTASASGTTKFVVDNSGNAYVGNLAVASTTAVCYQSATKNGATVYQLTDCNGTPADLAEYYPTNEDLEPGEIVAIGPVLGSYTTSDGQTHQAFTVERTKKTYDAKMIGVVSTKAWRVMGEDVLEWAEKASAIALVGRVPVKIAPDSEPIKAGDLLTSSETPGAAQKATKDGYIIGKALEDWQPENGQEKILILLNQSVSLNNLLAKEASTSELETRLAQIELALTTNTNQQDEADKFLVEELTVLSRAILPETTIVGQLTIGNLQINDNESSINATGKLKLQPLALDGIEFIGNSIKMDKNGNLYIKEGVIAGNDKIRDSIKIPAGQNQIVVERNWDKPPAVIITTASFQTTVWVTEKSEKGFVINLSPAPTEPATVDWLAIW